MTFSPNPSAEAGFLSTVFLNPRSYAFLFELISLIYHIPVAAILIGYLAADITSPCDDEDSAMDLWIIVALGLHCAMIILGFATMLTIACSPVSQPHKAWIPMVLLSYVVSFLDLGWTLYGLYLAIQLLSQGHRLALIDSGRCQFDHRKLIAIQSLLFIQLVLSCLSNILWLLYHLLCFNRKNAQRDRFSSCFASCCSSVFMLFSCKQAEDYSDIWKKLGEMLTEHLVLQAEDGTHRFVSLEDCKLSLGLIKKKHKANIPLRFEKLRERMETPSECPTLSEAQLRELTRMSQLAIGTYGWMVLLAGYPLRFFQKLMCCRLTRCYRGKSRFAWTESEGLLGHSSSFLIALSRIGDKSLLYANYNNDIHRSPFAIIKDEETKTLIVSIRGSLSPMDMITDGLATPERMIELECGWNSFSHLGILKSSRNLYKELRRGIPREILTQYLSPHSPRNEKDTPGSSFATASVSSSAPSPALDTEDEEEGDQWKLVLTGHSLGAAIATLVTLMLRQVYPNVQCFAYAPPPTLDPQTAEWAKSCVTTIVCGTDIVPRLSERSIAALRDEMIIEYAKVYHKPLYYVTRKSSAVALSAIHDGILTAARTVHGSMRSFHSELSTRSLRKSITAPPSLPTSASNPGLLAASPSLPSLSKRQSTGIEEPATYSLQETPRADSSQGDGVNSDHIAVAMAQDSDEARKQSSAGCKLPLPPLAIPALEVEANAEKELRDLVLELSPLSETSPIVVESSGAREDMLSPTEEMLVPSLPPTPSTPGPAHSLAPLKEDTSVIDIIRKRFARNVHEYQELRLAGKVIHFEEIPVQKKSKACSCLRPEEKKVWVEEVCASTIDHLVLADASCITNHMPWNYVSCLEKALEQAVKSKTS